MTTTRGLEVALSLPLDRFDLEVEIRCAAHVTGIFGPSGAGKSSLLKAVAGLIRRGVRGRIRFGDEVWLDSERGIYVPPERRGIGYVPQDGLLFPHLNVRQNLMAGAARSRDRGRSSAATFDSVCELLRLAPLLERRVASLSGGERQRVALGRAICSGPRLLLLDEPLASLDLPLRREVLPFLRRLRAESSIPMLLVTHEPVEVQALCDDVITLDRGRVVTSGPVREILRRLDAFVAPDHEFENVLPCMVVESGAETSRVRIGGPQGGGVELVTPGIDLPAGAEVLIGVSSREITLATEPPSAISASNALAAEIRSIQESGMLRLVTAAIESADVEVAVTVTGRACDRLALAPGRRIYLIVKATSCIVFGSQAFN